MLYVVMHAYTLANMNKLHHLHPVEWNKWSTDNHIQLLFTTLVILQLLTNQEAVSPCW